MTPANPIRRFVEAASAGDTEAFAATTNEAFLGERSFRGRHGSCAGTCRDIPVETRPSPGAAGCEVMTGAAFVALQ